MKYEQNNSCEVIKIILVHYRYLINVSFYNYDYDQYSILSATSVTQSATCIGDCLGMIDGFLNRQDKKQGKQFKLFWPRQLV